MNKKLFSLIFVATVISFALPANAQFGNALKKAGKSVVKSVGDVAGDMAADVAANKVSEKIINFMDNNNTLADEGSDYYTRLAKLVSDKYVTVGDLSLSYKIYESMEANILATADGNIRVYTGMMDILNDDELLAVIALQIGHIANKDVRDALMKVASEDNATKASGAQLEKMLSFSGDKLGSIVNELIQIPYSDEQNKKADEYAFNLLKKNGNDTSALISVLNKFAEMEAQDKETLESEEGEISVASKYIGVNSNNAVRASLLETEE